MCGADAEGTGMCLDELISCLRPDTAKALAGGCRSVFT